MITHLPIMQAGVPLGALQVRAQAPQFLMSASTLVSQPFCGSPSQSAKPALHMPITHLPPVQLADALGTALHITPQAPQLAPSLPVAISQPSPTRLLQSV